LEQLPVDCSPTEDELVFAFNGLRVHTSTSEPYFWEHCYNIYPATSPQLLILVEKHTFSNQFLFRLSHYLKQSAQTKREQMQQLMQSADGNVTRSCVSYHKTPYRL